MHIQTPTMSAKTTLAAAMAAHDVRRIDTITEDATLECLRTGRAAFFNASGYQNQFAANALHAAMAGECDLFSGEVFDGLADYLTHYAKHYRGGGWYIRQFLHTIIPLNEAAHMELARVHKMIALEDI